MDSDFNSDPSRKAGLKKKVPETDGIFEELQRRREEAQGNEAILRVSMDAKATVLIGLLSREGKSRIRVRAYDHDFHPEETVTPYGIYLPDHNEVHFFVSGPVTSDCMVDCLQKTWEDIHSRFPPVQTLLIHQDCGPQNSSRRTQFMKRMAGFADVSQLTLSLAYYPPYHSKYNPVERVWGVLEHHWNGTLLDSIDTAIRCAETMTWKGNHPRVQRVGERYETGVRLTTKEMNVLEKRFTRLPGLEKYFVDILPKPVTIPV
jgi:hypothetical protein